VNRSSCIIKSSVNSSSAKSSAESCANSSAKSSAKSRANNCAKNSTTSSNIGVKLTPKNNFGFLYAELCPLLNVDPSMSGSCHFSNFELKPNCTNAVIMSSENSLKKLCIFKKILIFKNIFLHNKLLKMNIKNEFKMNLKFCKIYIC
jgi:hypothetical protein